MNNILLGFHYVDRLIANNLFIPMMNKSKWSKQFAWAWITLLTWLFINLWFSYRKDPSINLLQISAIAIIFYTFQEIIRKAKNREEFSTNGERYLFLLMMPISPFLHGTVVFSPASCFLTLTFLYLTTDLTQMIPKYPEIEEDDDDW